MPKTPKISTSSGSREGRNIQQNPTARFCCPHCGFQGCNQYSLKMHLLHHSNKYSAQCTICTYSASNFRALMKHLYRVHPEEAAVIKESKAEKLRASVATPDLTAHEDQHTVEAEETQFNGEAQFEHEIQPAAEEMVYVTIETKDSDGEEVMMIQDYLDNPWCCSCGKQSNDNQAPLVQCDQCDTWFHGSCIGPDHHLDGLWFCPACIHKISPTRHMTKLIEAVDSLIQVYGSERLSSGLYTSLLNSDDGGLLNQIANPSMSVSIIEVLSGDKEEIKCRKDLAQLDLDIRSSRAKITQASKDLQDETRLMRASRAEHFHQRMEKLKFIGQDLSAELAVLMKAKRRNQEVETEKTQLKMKTDEQLFNLRLSSCSKVKKEASLGSQFSLEKTEEEEIQKREILLAQLKKKLSELWEEERSLNEQIQATEKKRDENSKNLESLQALYFNPAPEETSQIAARIKAMKRELRDQVERFAGLELRLLELGSKKIKEDILQKKKEWLDSYDCDDEI